MNKCQNPKLVVIEMPAKENATVKFKNYHRMQRQPYTVYSDFECILEELNICEPNPEKSHTTTYQHHIPCGYAMAEVFQCCSDTHMLGEVQVYRGKETVQQFLEQLISWGLKYQYMYDNQKKVNMR